MKKLKIAVREPAALQEMLHLKETEQIYSNISPWKWL